MNQPNRSSKVEPIYGVVNEDDQYVYYRWPPSLVRKINEVAHIAGLDRDGAVEMLFEMILEKYAPLLESLKREGT